MSNADEKVDPSSVHDEHRSAGKPKGNDTQSQFGALPERLLPGLQLYACHNKISVQRLCQTKEETNAMHQYRSLLYAELASAV